MLNIIYIYIYILSCFSCLWLCDLWCIPGSSVYKILQARMLELIAVPSSRGSFWTRDQTHVSYVSSIGWQFLSTSTTWEGLYIWWKWKIAQSCPTICDPMHYTVHGILQARILKWVAFPFSRGSSQPTDQTQVSLIAGRFFTSWTIRDAPYIWWRTPYIYTVKDGEGHGSLACCSLWGHRVGHDWATEKQQQYIYLYIVQVWLNEYGNECWNWSLWYDENGSPEAIHVLIPGTYEWSLVWKQNLSRCN